METFELFDNVRVKETNEIGIVFTADHETGIYMVSLGNGTIRKFLEIDLKLVSDFELAKEIYNNEIAILRQ